jgi:hypothetical protein
VAFVAAAGGGTLTLSTPNNNQIVQPPFNTGIVNPLVFLAADGVFNPPGAPVAKDVDDLAAAVVFSCGLLTNAPTGYLVLVFDVNFMQAGADANSQTFTTNLINYLTTPTCVAAPAPIHTIPTLSEWGLAALAMLIALFGAGAMRRRFPMPAR